MRNRLFLFFFLLGLTALGQSSVLFSGRIVEDKTLEPLPWVIIVNARTEEAFATEDDGSFSLRGQAGDTLVFSKPGFSYRYAAIRAEQNVQITLLPQNYLLEEVPVTAYKLTSNLPKEMPMQSPARPEGSGIQVPTRVKPTMANPLDLLYDQFGNRPRQLRELEAILESESYREKLAESQNRSALFELTGLTASQVEEFLLFCQWNESQIRSATDYVLLQSLLVCFEEFQAIQAAEAAASPN